MNNLIAWIAALIIHETGHLLVSRMMGIPLVCFRLNPVGGVMTFDFTGVGYGKEAAVHFSGPAAGLISAVIGILCGEVFFSGISAVLAFVNLLPVRGLDGGGILRCILSLFFLPDTVWRVCRILSAAGVLLLWTAVLWIEMRVGANIGLLAFVVTLLLRETKRPEEY